MRTTAALNIAILLVASTLPSQLYAATPIKTMSFNIRYDTSSDGVNAWNTGTIPRRTLAVQVIDDFAPDILGVQEALRNQVLNLKADLPEFDFYGVGRDNGIQSGEHSAIYYRSDRFTRTNQGTFWLTLTPDRPSRYPGACCNRIASWAVLQDKLDGNREYFVLNTHWDHQITAANDHSATLIRERLGLLSGGRPMIVMGDLNSTESSTAYRRLIGLEDPTGLQLIDAYRDMTPTIGRDEATFHGYSGGTRGSRIDFVLHDESFETLDATIIRTSYAGRYPSDHFPVTATLRLRIPEPRSTVMELLAILGMIAGQSAKLYRSSS
ncbi:MAG: hypothetical protein C0485_13790 [Pirellula sp.]|nr:hypothetical protein [Pirellula sp.]